MSSPESLIPACPGLLRIVAARDGGLCRIKLPGGALSATQASAIADAATHHACGIVEATNRANLQIRGVHAGREPALIDVLMNAGLGPSQGPGGLADPTIMARDDVRNVMLSPTAGRDPGALIDTSSLAAQLLALLQTDPRLQALPAKFAVLLDGGERLAKLDHPHDVWLAAMPGVDGPRFAFGLAGCPPTSHPHAEERHPPALAAVLPSQAGALAGALLHTFLDLAAPGDTRMRHLLASHSTEAVLQHVQARVDFPLMRDAQIDTWRRSATDPSLRFGAHRQRASGMWHVGGQPPLGRLDAPMLRGLATLARDLSPAGTNGPDAATLRITPWQGVLLTDIPDDAVAPALAGLTTLGIARDGAEPLTRLIACAGSSGCTKSLADTKGDALHLAALFRAGQNDAGTALSTEVHLTGCPRSCAAAHRAPYTLLAVAPGRYDLYRRDAAPGFGRCVARHVTIDQASAFLQRPVRSLTHD